VALAEGSRLVGERVLDEARRHARDLAPACAALLAEQGWKARDLAAVIISKGPGSYTGLRVGVMSAKTLAYATGCALVGVETFAAIALQAPAEAHRLDVIADAQQNKLYVQCFCRPDGGPWQAEPLTIGVIDAWLGTLTADVWLTGPGLHKVRDQLPRGTPIAPETAWLPRPASLLELGLARFRRGQRDDVFQTEPIYLRASSAEETWASRAKSGG
jgi:tRNA threonylcarbamoyladenosine biosynthesis protein TsaB